VSAAVVERIRAQLADGSGILKIAKLIGSGVGTVHRIKRKMAGAAA
jgi:DNA invertase Pin-like site-specific DNA recombinase